jgi:hypothetical protein
MKTLKQIRKVVIAVVGFTVLLIRAYNSGNRVCLGKTVARKSKVYNRTNNKRFQKKKRRLVDFQHHQSHIIMLRGFPNK